MMISPSGQVDAEDADVPLLLHVHRGRASLYRVLSGASSTRTTCETTW